MLTIVKQTDILKHWDKVDKCIEYLIQTTLKDPKDGQLLRDVIRESLLKDVFKLWILTGADNTIKCIVITTNSLVSYVQKSLHIYALLGFEHITEEEYVKSFDTLKTFARSTGCRLITAESSNDFIVSKFKELGGTGYSLNLYWEV